MGHDEQIEAAYNAETKTYDYHPVFEKIKPYFQKADFTIGNLELTFAGKPYKGYPQFSSPETLANACKNSGVDVLVTANNHSCDGRKKGIVGTLNVLDSVGIAHTGTFRNQDEFDKKNLLILSKNGIKIGLLNYTYGTNGLPVPPPTIVNLIDLEKIKIDLKKAEKENLDKLIVFVHWGSEYQQQPNSEQQKTADFLFKNGADIVIGSHPHVIQPMHYTPKTENQKERLIAYSLGNFVSNQRTSPRDGGTMLQITLEKEDTTTKIKDCGYVLTWVHKKRIENHKPFFEILPCKAYENQNFVDLDENAIKKMKIFIDNSRNLLEKYNTNVKENE